MDSGREELGDVVSYIIIGFLGRFTGETGENYHQNPVTSTTDSGIEVIKWRVLFMLALGEKVINSGSMLHDEEGSKVPIEALDVIFHEVLK